MLVHQFKAENDRKEVGDFKDVGFQRLATYGDQTNLPSGHWVYVAPYWYIWRDLTESGQPRRPWGQEQMIGPPDVFPLSGDVQQAWASLSEDAQDEWILLEYEKPISPKAVMIYETFNPGGVTKVSAFKLDGEEVVIWKGKDPTPIGSAKGLSVVPVRVTFKTTRIKVYIDSMNVGGWNEIDTVGVRDTRGKTYYPVAAEASTTYAAQAVAPPVIDFDEERVKKLEKEVDELKARAAKLEERLKKKTKP